MAVIERGVTYTCEKPFGNYTKLFAGFDYTIINSEEDAKARNVDVIRIEPFTKRTGTYDNAYYSLTWITVTLDVKYNGSLIKSPRFTRRYRVFDRGSANVKYYFKTTSERYWSGSNPYQNAIGQTSFGNTFYNELDYLNTHDGNYGLVVEIPHNDDGTPQGSVEIILGGSGNGTYGYGNSDTPCKPAVTFELSKIDRGTRVYRYNGSTWEKSALVHVQGETAGAQHYVYRYNGSSWVKYYG